MNGDLVTRLAAAARASDPAIHPRAQSRFDPLAELRSETEGEPLGARTWAHLFQPAPVGATDEVALAVRLGRNADGALTQPVGGEPTGEDAANADDGIVPAAFTEAVRDPSRAAELRSAETGRRPLPVVSPATPGASRDAETFTPPAPAQRDRHGSPASGTHAAPASPSPNRVDVAGADAPGAAATQTSRTRGDGFSAGVPPPRARKPQGEPPIQRSVAEVFSTAPVTRAPVEDATGTASWANRRLDVINATRTPPHPHDTGTASGNVPAAGVPAVEPKSQEDGALQRESLHGAAAPASPQHIDASGDAVPDRTDAATASIGAPAVDAASSTQSAVVSGGVAAAQTPDRRDVPAIQRTRDVLPVVPAPTPADAPHATPSVDRRVDAGSAARTAAQSQRSDAASVGAAVAENGSGEDPASRGEPAHDAAATSGSPQRPNVASAGAVVEEMQSGEGPASRGEVGHDAVASDSPRRLDATGDLAPDRAAYETSPARARQSDVTSPVERAARSTGVSATQIPEWSDEPAIQRTVDRSAPSPARSALEASPAASSAHRNLDVGSVTRTPAQSQSSDAVSAAAPAVYNEPEEGTVPRRGTALGAAVSGSSQHVGVTGHRVPDPVAPEISPASAAVLDVTSSLEDAARSAGASAARTPDQRDEPAIQRTVAEVSSAAPAMQDRPAQRTVAGASSAAAARHDQLIEHVPSPSARRGAAAAGEFEAPPAKSAGTSIGPRAGHEAALVQTVDGTRSAAPTGTFSAAAPPTMRTPGTQDQAEIRRHQREPAIQRTVAEVPMTGPPAPAQVHARTAASFSYSRVDAGRAAETPAQTSDAVSAAAVISPEPERGETLHRAPARAAAFGVTQGVDAIGDAVPVPVEATIAPVTAPPAAGGTEPWSAESAAEPFAKRAIDAAAVQRGKRDATVPLRTPYAPGPPSPALSREGEPAIQTSVADVSPTAPRAQFRLVEPSSPLPGRHDAAPAAGTEPQSPDLATTSIGVRARDAAVSVHHETRAARNDESPAAPMLSVTEPALTNPRATGDALSTRTPPARGPEPQDEPAIQRSVADVSPTAPPAQFRLVESSSPPPARHDAAPAAGTEPQSADVATASIGLRARDAAVSVDHEMHAARNDESPAVLASSDTEPGLTNPRATGDALSTETPSMRTSATTEEPPIRRVAAVATTAPPAQGRFTKAVPSPSARRGAAAADGVEPQLSKTATASTSIQAGDRTAPVHDERRRSSAQLRAVSPAQRSTAATEAFEPPDTNAIRRAPTGQPAAGTPASPAAPDATDGTDATDAPPVTAPLPGVAPRIVPSAAGGELARSREREQEQTLRINIGRIRVEAPAAPSAPARAIVSRPRPHVSLEEYTRRRRGES